MDVMNELLRTLGRRLREVRKEKGFSQEALSREPGYDRTYVGKVERAERSPSLEAIQRISDILNVLPYKLF